VLLVPEPEPAGTVVVVVVVDVPDDAGVLVVVVLAGTVVVVASGLTRLLRPGVVVVVVVEDVVVVVGATVVVVVVVLGVAGEPDVADGVVPFGVLDVAGVAAGVGVVITAVVQAPAFCRVVTSATRRVSERFSLLLSDVKVDSSCCSVFWTPSRCESATFTAAVAACDCASRSDATTLAYCWATTPSWPGVPNGAVFVPVTMEGLS
jgi:hypothetical protein